MSPWACDVGTPVGIKGAALEAGEHLGENLGAAGQEFGEHSPTTCPVSAVQRKAPDVREEGEGRGSPRSPQPAAGRGGGRGSVCGRERWGEGSRLGRGRAGWGGRVCCWGWWGPHTQLAPGTQVQPCRQKR